MKDHFMELVKSRRSIRKFSGASIPDTVIDQILEAAAYAPSSWGGHPVEYIVIRDKQRMAALAKCKAMGAGPLADSDVVILPIVDKRDLELWVEDAAVASTYLLLAAESFGVGACWIHMKDRKGHTGMAEEDIRSLLGIPEHYGILNAVSFGMKLAPAQRHDLSPRVHEEVYEG